MSSYLLPRGLGSWLSCSKDCVCFHTFCCRKASRVPPDRGQRASSESVSGVPPVMSRRIYPRDGRRHGRRTAIGSELSPGGVGLAVFFFIATASLRPALLVSSSFHHPRGLHSSLFSSSTPSPLFVKSNRNVHHTHFSRSGLLRCPPRCSR